MSLPIRLLLRLLRIRAGRTFVALVIVGGIAGFPVTHVNAQAVSNLFIYPFNPAVIKISLAPTARWGLFRLSDSISITTTDNSPIRVINLSGGVVYLGPPTTLSLGLGHYFVECNGDRTQFCVLPNDYAGASFLGAEANDGSDPALTQRMAAVNPTWVRAFQSIWAEVQTNQNTWAWSEMDDAVAANPGRKIIAITADLVPTWASANQIIPLHTAYVQALASRYKGQLAAIEIWNEPYDDKFPNTTDVNSFVSFYLQLFSQAQSAVHAVDSTPQVIGPAFASLLQAESLSMATNPLATFDGWSWHDYYRGDFAPDVDYLAPSWIRSISKSHLEWDCGRFADLPSLFVDEIGFYGHSALGTDTGTNVNTSEASELDWHRGMCRAIKMTAMYRAAGVGCIIPHILCFADDLTNPNFEVCGWDYGFRGPHPKTTAFLMTGYWLDGAALADYRTPGLTVFLYAWQRTNNTSLVIAWAVEGQTISLSNNTLAATDIYGSSISVSNLTETPVVFQSSSLSATALLANVLATLPTNVFVPPILAPVGTQSIPKGQPLQFTLSAVDSNHYPVTYSASSLPAGASFNPTTGAFSWTPAAGQVGTYTVTFAATDGPATSTPLSVTINVVGNLFDGLADYWNFNEDAGTNAADSVGKANGSLAGFTFVPPYGWVPGVSGSALSCDGINSYAVLPSSALSFTNNFTVAATIYPRNAAGVGAFISVRSYYQVSGFCFDIDGNSLYLLGQTSAGLQTAAFDIGGIQNGNWYRIVVVYDQSTVSAYINGVYQGSASWGGNLIMNPTAASQIGDFNGIIDEVMIFNRVLGATEIAALPQGVFQALTPTVTALKITGSNAVISFTTVSSTVTNETYEVDSRGDMKTGAWLVLTNGIPGTGGTISITDTAVAGPGQRFYRVGGHF